MCGRSGGLNACMMLSTYDGFIGTEPPHKWRRICVQWNIILHFKRKKVLIDAEIWKTLEIICKVK
jgi:hypothetical protein